MFRATGQAKKKHRHIFIFQLKFNGGVNRWLCEFLLSPPLGGTLSEHGMLKRFQKGVRQFILSKECPTLGLIRKRVCLNGEGSICLTFGQKAVQHGTTGRNPNGGRGPQGLFSVPQAVHSQPIR